MNRLSLNAKLWVALALMWAGLLLLSGWSAWQNRTIMLDERKEGLRHIISTAEGIVKDYQAQAAAGAMSTEDARKAAMHQLSMMRYSGNGYLIITNSRPVVLMHPVLADLRNKDVSTYKDSDGKLLFVEMVKVAQEKGEGFVDYMGRLAGVEGRVKKLSYVKAFKPWDQGRSIKSRLHSMAVMKGL